MIFENLKMAGRSITGNKLRTLLTMLGIIIGVAAVVSINSLGLGLKKVVTEQVSDLGSNIIFVVPGKVISSSGNGKQSSNINPASSIGTSTLTEADVATVKTSSHVAAVAPISVISGLVAAGNTPADGALIIATTPEYTQALPNQKIGTGRFIEEADQGKFVVVLGPEARDALFGKDADAINKKVMVRGQEFTVIGVFKGSEQANTSSLGGGSTFGNAAFIPTKTATSITNTSLQIYRIAVQAKSQGDVQPAVDELNTSLKKNHGGQEDFSVITQKDILSTFDTILSALTTAISAIAAISLLVGGIGIMNIMLVSVTERTREVGLRKALGATSGMVLSQFLIEAMVLTIFGGLLGVGLAFISGFAIEKLAHITPVFDANTIVLAFAISAGIGIVFGIAPAIKAARMKPIEALRYE
jgi:putative ABC transport system permease protein